MPLTLSHSLRPQSITSPFVSTPTTSIQCPSPHSLSPISVSNKNVENHLTSFKKKAEGIRSQGETTHQLILELYARLGFTPPATTAPVVTQPAHPTSLPPFGVPLVGRHNSPSHFTSPTLPRLAPIAHPAPPPKTPEPVDTDVAPRAKTFSYTCRLCGDNDHWSKDCPQPHRFDVRYLSKAEIWKVLDDRLKAESLALSGPPKDEDNIIPVQAAPPPPEPTTPLTPSTSSLEGDLCCTSDPPSAAPLETLASSRRLPKVGAIVRATSPPLTLMPILTPHVPTLRPVERPYIPPDLWMHWNTRCPMGSFRQYFSVPH